MKPIPLHFSSIYSTRFSPDIFLSFLSSALTIRLVGHEKRSICKSSKLVAFFVNRKEKKRRLLFQERTRKEKEKENLCMPFQLFLQHKNRGFALFYFILSRSTLIPLLYSKYVVFLSMPFYFIHQYDNFQRWITKTGTIFLSFMFFDPLGQCWAFLWNKFFFWGMGELWRGGLERGGNTFRM